MAQRLLTLRNPTGATITVRWDGFDYSFAAGTKMTLDNGLAAALRDRAPSLTIVAARFRHVPSELVATDVTVNNTSAEPITVTLDGQTHTVSDGESATFDASVADVMAIEAATNGYDMSLEDISGEVAAIAQV